MSKEQIFWVAVIIILNFAAYLIGKHEGRLLERKMMTIILNAVAPCEMDAAMDKLNKCDPVELALRVMNEGLEEEQG